MPQRALSLVANLVITTTSFSMEKIIYLMKPAAGIGSDQFRDLALSELAKQLLADTNVHGLRMAFNDSDVARAEGLKRGGCPPLPDAAFSVWVDTANEQQALIDTIEPHTSHLEAYLVCESEVMAPPNRSGERTPGTLQLCMLRHPDTIEREEFLALWRDSHSQIACDTQSTFGYRQNLIVRKMNGNAQDHDAIVEEHFPADAMDSPAAFYDAVGDDAKLKKNVKTMIDSVSRFIDNNTINVVHMSEYELSP